MHGLNEHTGRYEHVGQHWADSGIDVRAHDHRGHGRTWGRRSYIQEFSLFLDDLEAHLQDLREEDSELPLILVGHSMGGLIVHAYCLDHRPLPDLLVSSGAVLQPSGVPKWQRRIAPLVARLFPKLKVGGKIDGSVLSRDPTVAEGYRNDPLVPVGVTSSLGLALFEGMSLVRERNKQLSIPCLALHGGADELVRPEATEMLEELPGVDRRVIAEMRHEVFNEFGYEEVLTDVVEWIQEQVDSLV